MDNKKVSSINTENTLNLKAKLNQSTVVKTISAIDWDTTSQSPLVVELDPTTACNLACPDCINRELLNQGLFTKKRLHELVKEIVDAGVKAVVLIGGGEPLMHPEIGWAIRYFGENGVQLGITTNGLLINKYRDVIAEYASWTRVSVDAGSASVYNKIRPSISGKSEFENILKNMHELSKLKRGKLGYSFMIYSSGMFNTVHVLDKLPMQHSFKPTIDTSVPFSNVEDIFNAAKLAKEIGCDYCEIKPMYDANHYLIVQNKDLMERASVLIEKTKELEDENFKVLQATKLHHLLKGEDNIEIKKYTRCAVAQLRTLVTPSGVYVCPYFRGRADKRLGNVMQQSFLDMWHGEQRKTIIRELNPMIDCKMHCIRHESNLNIEGMVSNNIAPEIIADFDLFI